MSRSLAPSDRLSLAWVAGFVAFALAAEPRPWITVALLAALAAFLVLVAQWATRSRAGDLVHTFVSPYVAVTTLFELSGRVAGARRSGRWDELFASLDARWFPRLGGAWHGALGRPTWLTDFAGLAYVAFYALPLVVGLLLFFRRSRRALDDFVFATEASFFLPYVGYLATPTLGPRAETDLHGATLAQAAHAFVGVVELNAHDAFPSGHTVVAVVVALAGARAFPKWSAAFALVSGSIVFSTVYLSYHYVVDVVAGLGIAAAMPLLLPALRLACGWRNGFVLHAKGAQTAR